MILTVQHSSSISGINQNIPRIISLPDVTAVQKKVGQDIVRIVCTVASSTPSKVSWTFNGSPVPYDTDGLCTYYVGPFQIRSVKRLPPNHIHMLAACRINYTINQGKYSCHARNQFGSVSKDMTLTIHGKLFFLVFLMN